MSFFKLVRTNECIRRAVVWLTTKFEDIANSMQQSNADITPYLNINWTVVT